MFFKYINCCALLRQGMLRALVLAGVALLGACDDPPTSLEKVHSRGELVVGTRFAATTYYKGAGGSTGLEYDLARLFANQLGVDLRLKVADSFSKILPWVVEGQVDLAAAGITVTERRQEYVRFGPSYHTVTAQLVRRLGNPISNQFDGLAGRLEVVAGSSHVEYLQKAKRRHPSLTWVENYELESESLLFMVSSGKIDFTVADSNEITMNRFLYPDLKVAFDVSLPEPLAWAFPIGPDDSLYKEAQAFFARIKEDGTLGRLMDRYYGHLPEFNYVGTSSFLKHIRTRLPKYRELFMQGGDAIGEDWRLLAAIGYQESHWNPKAVSPTGVRGIMMLTRNTTEYLGLNNRVDPQQSILGGARYFSLVKKKVPARISEPDRTWLALAAYNIGFGHLEDARKLTEGQGGNPDKWVDVKERLPLLSQSKWYRSTEYGYARGQVSVQYVENVRSYYDILIWATQRNRALLREMDSYEVETSSTW